MTFASDILMSKDGSDRKISIGSQAGFQSQKFLLEIVEQFSGAVHI